MTVLARTRLRIRDQAELLNQIAGTYRDFFRAAMEYVDNAVDAAAAVKQSGKRLAAELHVQIDTVAKRVTFTDNCGGMSAQELSELLSEVGRSKKKAAPWANGQFGFGIHAFRAFAKEAIFVSRQGTGPGARVRIDRAYDEEKDVLIEAVPVKDLERPGTAVIVARFDAQVFRKAVFFKSLVSEIEHHFDDVLRAGVIRIFMREDRSREYECRFFDYAALSGTALKKHVSLRGGKRLDVDLKILDRVQENRLPALMNKQRRIQAIGDLKSYKVFARSSGITTYVWANPFVVGGIEINDACSPNLSRDDLRDSPEREVVYEALSEIQRELERLVDASMNRKIQESYKKLADSMSETLSRILRAFRLQFQQPSASPVAGEFDEVTSPGDGENPFGGEGPGGGGPGPGAGGGLDEDREGQGGVGEGATGGGAGRRRAGSEAGGSTPQLREASGPRIEFQAHSGEDRVIDLGSSLVINTLHPDFISRNNSKAGRIRLDARLLNYVALVIAPPCVHRLFEKRGRVPTALEAGVNIVDLSMKLEQDLTVAMLGMELTEAPTR